MINISPITQKSLNDHWHQVENVINDLHLTSQSIQKFIFGQENNLNLIFACLIANGHVLLEDLPGSGKTTLAKILAQHLSLDFSRIQFTPDLMPADILGTSIFQPQKQEFIFHPGPIFSSLILADEINRASPRTQSALLEAMEEFQVSIDSKKYVLDECFFVIATENPLEMQGTFTLPEAQLDRFMIKLQMNKLSEAEEIDLLQQKSTHFFADPIVFPKNKILILQQALKSIHVSPACAKYVIDILNATRKDNALKYGLSSRAGIALIKLAQGLALLDKEKFLTPKYIHIAAVAALSHRIQFNNNSYDFKDQKKYITNLLHTISPQI